MAPLKPPIVTAAGHLTATRLKDHAPRTWQRMLSGRRLNLIEPSPLDAPPLKTESGDQDIKSESQRSEQSKGAYL